MNKFKRIKMVNNMISGIVLISLGASLTSAQTVDSITMGEGYANDVFYSMSSGTVKTVPNQNWHIAFSTAVFSSTIITNDGAGVVLYTYPGGDKGAWDTLSAEGMESWIPQYNSPDTAMIGAFDRNALGHPDYGWGIYSGMTHDVVGDSLFVIQLPDQSYRKLWIHKKISVENKYIVQYAGLDGSGDTTLTLDINPYTSKNFIYFSLETDTLLDREPEESWDILFTRYYDERIPYIVTGVVSNLDVEAARIAGADTSMTCFDSIPYSLRRTVIGSDWKRFNMGTFQYELEDSLAFVVRDTTGTETILYFTEFEGSSTGKAVFVKKPLDCATGKSFLKIASSLHVFPNPADDVLFIQHALKGSGMIGLRLFDLTGKMVMEKALDAEAASRIPLDVSGLQTGLYILQLTRGDMHAVTRIGVR